MFDMHHRSRRKTILSRAILQSGGICVDMEDKEVYFSQRETIRAVAESMDKSRFEEKRRKIYIPDQADGFTQTLREEDRSLLLQQNGCGVSLQRGYKICDDFFFVIKQMGYELQVYQQYIIKECFAGMLPQIFGESFFLNQKDIFKRFGFKQAKKMFIVMLGRQWGKTTAVNIFIAACLLLIPSMSVLLFSKSKDLSHSNMSTIKDLFEKGRIALGNKYGKEWFEMVCVGKDNETHFEVKVSSSGDVRTMMSCIPTDVSLFFLYFCVRLRCVSLLSSMHE